MILAAPLTGESFLQPLAQTGLVGIILVLLLKGIGVVTRREYDKTIEQYEIRLTERDQDIRELKDANASLRTLTEQQIIPALVRTNQLAAEYATELAAERRRRRGG